MINDKLFLRLVLALVLTIPLTSARAQELDTLKVSYFDYSGQSKSGVIVCNHQITNKLQRIFKALHDARYPIASILPISEFSNNDELSMEANNTSCYCNRTISGSRKKSKHALGLAIDLNPLDNPCITYRANGKIKKIEPQTLTTHDPRLITHKISHSDLAYKLFRKEGFRWGGDWIHLKKDYQHFEY